MVYWYPANTQLAMQSLSPVSHYHNPTPIQILISNAFSPSTISPTAGLQVSNFSAQEHLKCSVGGSPITASFGERKAIPCKSRIQNPRLKRKGRENRREVKFLPDPNEKSAEVDQTVKIDIKERINRSYSQLSIVDRLIDCEVDRE